MNELNSILEPGMRVRLSGHPDWGIGEVQSNAAGKITVNFPDHGKVVFDSARVTLEPVFD